MRTKTFKKTLASIIIMSFLVGCGSNTANDTSSIVDEASNSSASTSEEVEIEKEFVPALDTEAAVVINVVGGYDNFPSLDEVTLDFNEYYPNVEVSYSKVDDYNNVKDMLMTDNPDVDIFMANNTWVKNSDVVKESVVNLADEELGFDLSALDEGVLESAKSGDELLRLPIYSTCTGLIVNKTLLEENNLEVPTNYEEFVSCCESLLAAGYTPIMGYDADGKNNFSQGLYSSMVMTLAAKKNENNEISTALNNEEEGAEEVYLEGLKQIEEFRQLGFYSSEANAEITDSYEAAILRFFEGDVPFLSATTETMSGTAKRESKSESFTENPFEYTFIAAPIGEDGAYAYINSNEGLALNKNGANLEYATEFLRFYCQVSELNASADAKGMLSTSAEPEAAASFPDLNLDNEEYVAYISDFYLDTYPSKTINEIIRMVSDDGISAEEALSQYAEIKEGFKEE